MNFESFSFLWKKRHLSQADKMFIHEHAAYLQAQSLTWDLLYLEENPNLAQCSLSDLLQRLRCLHLHARLMEDSFSELLYAFLASETTRDFRRYFKQLEPFLRDIDPQKEPAIFSLLGFYVYHPEQWFLLLSMWKTMIPEKALLQSAEYMINTIQCMYYLLNYHLNNRNNASLLDASTFFENTRKYFVWTELFNKTDNPFTPLLSHFNIVDIFDYRLKGIHQNHDRYFMFIRSLLLYWRDDFIAIQSHEQLRIHFQELKTLSTDYVKLLIEETGNEYSKDLFASLGVAPFSKSTDGDVKEADIYLE